MAFIPAEGGVMSDFIIAGYPKSGTTWASRLLAELIGCPAVGFWGMPYAVDIVSEGRERTSPHRCYKAHQPFHVLNMSASGTDTPQLVYIVRDPRDVIVSGSYYLRFNCYAPLPRNLRRMLDKIWQQMQAWTNSEAEPPSLVSHRKRLAHMHHAVLYGDTFADSWLSIPWAEHVTGFMTAGVPILRYEDLIENPEQECKRLLDLLGIVRDPATIRNAVARHEFQREKERFRRAGKVHATRHMRKGRVGEWRKHLATYQQELISQQLGHLLHQLNYE